jgi:hypothetical protein
MKGQMALSSDAHPYSEALFDLSLVLYRTTLRFFLSRSENEIFSLAGLFP